ncbi:MAG: EI24 domain-containing protein [Flavobacteriales bacterium]|nr:EI24 domain-containing protein [Flavobacteriales bacterium]
MFKDLGKGLKSYIKAISFITEHGFLKYFLYPFFIILMIFGTNYFFVKSTSGFIHDWLSGEFLNLGNADYFFSDFIKDNFGFFGGFFLTIITIIVGLIMYILLAFIGGYVVLLIMSPILAYISEKVVEVKTGEETPFIFSKFVKDVLRGVFMALRNLFMELLFMFMFFLMSFIPLIGLLSPLGVYLTTSYFYGFSFMDYSSERKGLGIGTSIRTVRKRKGMAVGLGGLFYLVMLIPFLGLFIAPFVAIISVVAATLCMEEVFEDQEKLPAVES